MLGLANANIANLLVNAIVEKQLLQFARSYLRGRMIDIGCGEKPYQQLLAPFVDEHVGLDHAETQHSGVRVDLEGTAYQIPTPDASFDSALCSAVLEHLEEPEQAIRECFRVLKGEGIAIYSIPFIWHLHEEPRDFYRYSKYGIQYLFEKVGFELLELKALSGFWVTFGQLMVYNIFRFNRGPLRWFYIVPLIGLMIQGLAYILDRIDRTEQWTWMYMVVAQKPLENDES